MKDMWNARYSAPGYAYGTSANEFFKTALSVLEPGRILLPAEGEGRNAVFAASLGWEVQALDFSEQARIKALALAAAHGVEISYDIADLESADVAADSFDAVGLIFAHMPPVLRRRVHAACAAALRPGGTLILQAYSKEQIEYGTGGPREAELLYSLEDIRADFSELQMELIERRIVELGEGVFHRGDSSVIRLIGKAQPQSL